MTSESKQRQVRIAASLLAADFSQLGRDIKSLNDGGCDEIHFDVMDGAFVPNITFGAPVLEWIRPLTNLPIDIHMMVEEPGRFIDDFAKAGADYFTVHAEACTHLHATIQSIKAAGMKAGVALNPGTPASVLDEILPDLDRVLVMTVNPGFGGQQFITGQLAKIAAIAEKLPWRADSADLAVDGGVKIDTAPSCAEAGASLLISGTGIFNHPDGVVSGIRALRESLA
ncbi:MAG: ribulose-phosphate 3-epimerase [Chloroflexi bacterium]|nr:ribulose-phosphate 3-epimerase [Chloroflexota bacterium]MBT4074579.1 ribulose-phosphate 3-epimerase [Chloroflexota bacterium]MBT4515308.1 ribulose-phosphate 3-epimerase [Chloroflexota bacterium]MBT5318610.1 ribulose-phosphate 3-epimerase [Chloroflexota bacterium]MBT6681720.1 ribulose-phosphate 3-epimerase [Chloroflexota bacterium]